MGWHTWLDVLASRLSSERMFSRGVGDREYLEGLIRDQQTPELFHREAPIDIQWSRGWRDGEATVRDGTFLSPMAGILPEEARVAHLRWFEPDQSTSATPTCIAFAATGDQGFALRTRVLARPLVQYGIATLILENPFYGLRRPMAQAGYAPPTLSDQFLMNTATITEGMSLVGYLREREQKRIGVTGISMGGSMAATVAVLQRSPIAAVPCLTGFGPRPIFFEGVLSRKVNFDGFKRPEIEMMKQVMDGADLRRGRPLAIDATILVAARDDAYVPPYAVRELHSHWTGTELRWLNAGHVSAFLFKSKEFVRAIVDAFERLRSV